MLGSVLNDLDSFRIFQLPVTTQRVLLKSAVDGKAVNLDWYVSTEGSGQSNDTEHFHATGNEASRPIVVLVHGIGGNSNEGYMVRLAHAFIKLGWRCVSYDYWRLDFGEWRDLSLAVTHLRKHYPRAPIAAVGISAGGHVLMRYLQCTGADCPLVAAVAISPCQDLIRDAQRVRREENPGYTYFLRYCLLTCVARHVAEGNWSKEEERACVRLGYLGRRWGYSGVVFAVCVAVPSVVVVNVVDVAAVAHALLSDVPNGLNQVTQCIPALTCLVHRYDVILRHSTNLDLEYVYDRVLSVQPNYSRPDGDEFESARSRSALIRASRLADAAVARARGDTAAEERLLYSQKLFEETGDHYLGTAAQHMDKISVTLLWIHAEDDPVGERPRRVYVCVHVKETLVLTLHVRVV